MVPLIICTTTYRYGYAASVSADFVVHETGVAVPFLMGVRGPESRAGGGGGARPKLAETTTPALFRTVLTGLGVLSRLAQFKLVYEAWKRMARKVKRLFA